VDIFCWIKAIGFAPKAGFVICLNNILLSKLNANAALKTVPSNLRLTSGSIGR
jgi:hypothetical protein